MLLSVDGALVPDRCRKTIRSGKSALPKLEVAMGLLIGMDEAGLGPNLGPLVVTVTVWEVPGSPREFDLWDAMSDIASQSPTKEPLKLHVADSKLVYSPGKGLVALERAVLSAMRLLGHAPQSLSQLDEQLSSVDKLEPRNSKLETTGSWLDRDLPLPTEVDASLIGDLATAWSECCRRAGVVLKAIRSEIVQPSRFNAIVRECDNKSLALSRISLDLLRSVWNPDDAQPTLVICDKHGGRNRYDDLLSEILDGQMIFSVGESRERSVYRIGSTEIRFQMKAEANFPVALASLVCKYVRELSMEVFNQFWSEHIPDLKPTAGYPVDAVRFKQDIAEAQQRLGITNDVLWRER
jgi:ribonuclease HII